MVLTIGQLMEIQSKVSLDKIRDLREQLTQLKNIKGLLENLPDVDKISIDEFQDTEDRVDIIFGDLHKMLKVLGIVGAPSISQPKTPTKEKAEGEKRTRAANRTPAQKAYDEDIAELTKEIKASLGINPKGRLKPEDQAKLDDAMAKEVKKRKLTPSPAPAA